MTTSRALAFAVFASCLLSVGCAKKIAAVCEAKCEAAGVAACQAAGEKAEATAEERGCESEFEDYAACFEKSGVCTGGVLAEGGACAREISALAACVG